MNTLSRIKIVLVEPQDGANIGSVCRAMKTMGITDLSIVGERINYDENRVFTLALHAKEIFLNANFFKTLKDALQDSVFTVGATRRRGKFRKMSSFSPEDLTKKIASIGEGIISIVFGRESDGLTDEEVNLCSAIVTIPTSDKFPSLNLSQAVQIICYELFKSNLPYKTGINPVQRKRIEKSSDTITKALNGIGYFKWSEEEKWTRQLVRDIIERSQLTESELQRFEKIFTKMETISKYKNKENKDEEF